MIIEVSVVVIALMFVVLSLFLILFFWNIFKRVKKILDPQEDTLTELVRWVGLSVDLFQKVKKAVKRRGK